MDTMMALQAIRERIPEYAKDLRLNLDAIAKVDSLTPQQLWGTALASALATRNGDLARAVADAARAHLDDAAFGSARTAAALMGMNNVYYRSMHLVANREYATMPARLRMQAIGNPGVDRLDFELFCLAVSAVNGCGRCLDSHEAEVRKRGATALAVQDAIRVAAILAGVAGVLAGEDALSTDRSDP